MPRVARNQNETTFFHIMTQGIEKRYIFQKDEDIKYYIKTMHKLMEEQNIQIIAYCIMNNHTHMLIKTENLQDMSKYMQRLNTKYGKYYNKKYNRVGYVFRDRYKSEGIYSEEQLYNCIKYIYNNPVKAGICCRAEDYPYSNYKRLNKEINGNYTFLDIEEDCENNYKILIKQFLENNNLDKRELKNNNEKLKELIVLLKEKNISLRKISDELNMNREKIRRVYNQENVSKISVPIDTKQLTKLNQYDRMHTRNIREETFYE